MTITGPTTLWGHLVHVAGDGSRATLRLRGGGLLLVAIPGALARELGGLVGRDVGLEGEARWRADDREILGFAVSRITEYRPDETSLTQSFRDLAKASGGRWDGVDASEHVKELRQGDDR